MLENNDIRERSCCLGHKEPEQVEKGGEQKCNLFKTGQKEHKQKV